MMKSDFGDAEAVTKAIEDIESKLKVKPNVRLQAEAEAGFHPNLLAHKGTLTGGKAIPVIEKYLIGATSFLRQPINYYDIFGAARCVLMTQLLGEALEIIDAAKIHSTEDRLKRLLPLVDSDSYDSTLAEFDLRKSFPIFNEQEPSPESGNYNTCDRENRSQSLERILRVCKKSNIWLSIVFLT